MRFSEVASTSGRIASTRSRTEKAALLADLLNRLEPLEVEAAVALLSGGPRQARLGLGSAGVQGAARVPRASVPSLTVRDVDETLGRIASLSGAGSGSERPRLFASLLGQATEEEADFLIRLVLGELRQGALGGLMEEALAKATRIPVSEVRLAMVVPGEPCAGGPAAVTEGQAAP